MNDRPDVLELLHVVNHTLAQEILPGATAEQRYTLRMIANALGIVTRELESQDITAAAETRSLNLLYGEPGAIDDLDIRNQQLANDIRDGLFEGSSVHEAHLRKYLVETARAKLAVSYPRGLKSAK